LLQGIPDLAMRFRSGPNSISMPFNPCICNRNPHTITVGVSSASHAFAPPSVSVSYILDRHSQERATGRRTCRLMSACDS
jgi:hypothetical protein